MNRTPSPPRRVHTPPAPLHGDNYEPFSPRRSSRVAARNGLHHEQTDASPRTRRAVTPTASSKKRLSTRAPHFALSPPSSPGSPSHHQSPRTTRRVRPVVDLLDSDSEHAAPTPARRFLSTMAPGMLPTPAKTPRKRPLESEESLGSTARVLFPSRPATIEEAMPTPRKGRKTKNLFTLESFAEAAANEPGEKIAIFTDSKERIPTRDDEEDNPFVTSKGKGKSKAIPQKSGKASVKAQKMSEATARDEGMVYLFRGRKIFRKFNDNVASNVSHEDEVGDLSADERQVRKYAGHKARRPLTRSAIKPRLLFQEEIAKRNLENGVIEDDEEAETDIEVHVATPSRKKQKQAEQPTPGISETTPPPTVRKVRRQISFESWSRLKSRNSSGESAVESKKRTGEPLERGTDKRARTRS